MVTILQGHFSAGDGVETGVPGSGPEANGPGQAVVVGQRQRTQPKFGCAGDQFFGRGGAVKQ